LFFIAYFLRNFGEKFVSAIFPSVSPVFFMIILLLAVLFIARRNIEALARFSELSFILISLTLAVTFFIAAFHISPGNLLTPTYHDLPDILRSAVPLASLWSMITFALFFGENISYSGKRNTGEAVDENRVFRRGAAKFLLISALISLLASAAVIGVFNADTAANIAMPYFSIFRSIKSTGLIQSFETFFILLWTFTDFIMIAFYMFAASQIFKTAFKIDGGRERLFMFPVAFIILILAFFIGENNIEAEYFYVNILSWSSIILGYIFPFVLLLLGKLRRVL
jgi:hypothetical protein